MANRRMFSNDVIDSDAFFTLSKDAKLLFFELGMKADDDGFVSPARTLHELSLQNDVLEELEKNGFIIRFDSMVLIRHWRVMNYLQSDRYHPTIHQGLMRQVVPVDCVYEKKADTERIQNVYSMEAQYSIGYISPDKGSPDQFISDDAEAGSQKQNSSGFIPPTKEQVEEYCRKIGLDTGKTNIPGFLDYNASRGWKNTTDWMPLFNIWASKAITGKTVSAQQYAQRDYTEEELDNGCTAELIAEARAMREGRNEQQA